MNENKSLDGFEFKFYRQQDQADADPPESFLQKPQNAPDAGRKKYYYSNTGRGVQKKPNRLTQKVSKGSAQVMTHHPKHILSKKNFFTAKGSDTCNRLIHHNISPKRTIPPDLNPNRTDLNSEINNLNEKIETRLQANKSPSKVNPAELMRQNVHQQVSCQKSPEQVLKKMELRGILKMKLQQEKLEREPQPIEEKSQEEKERPSYRDPWLNNASLIFRDKSPLFQDCKEIFLKKNCTRGRPHPDDANPNEKESFMSRLCAKSPYSTISNTSDADHLNIFPSRNNDNDSTNLERRPTPKPIKPRRNVLLGSSLYKSANPHKYSSYGRPKTPRNGTTSNDQLLLQSNLKKFYSSRQNSNKNPQKFL